VRFLEREANRMQDTRRRGKQVFASLVIAALLLLMNGKSSSNAASPIPTTMGERVRVSSAAHRNFHCSSSDLTPTLAEVQRYGVGARVTLAELQRYGIAL